MTDVMVAVGSTGVRFEVAECGPKDLSRGITLRSRPTWLAKFLLFLPRGITLFHCSEASSSIREDIGGLSGHLSVGSWKVTIGVGAGTFHPGPGPQLSSLLQLSALPHLL